jgi:uncharacterized protein YbjT (DUF2867 family)
MTEQTCILVTGATGNVGSVLVKKLLDFEGIKVRAAVRSLSKAASYQDLGVEAVEMDLTKPDTITTAFTGVQKVFILTPFTPNFDELTRSLCEAATQAGTVEHIVKLSVMGASDKSPLDTSRRHYQSEKHIEATGIPYTFIRPTAFAQQLTGIFPWVYRRGEDSFYLPIGDAKVAWLDTRDIATVAAQALATPGHEGKVYQLTGPTAVSCPEIATMISEATGRTMNYVDMPEESYKQRMSESGLTEHQVGQMSIIYRDMKDGWLAHVSDDFEKVVGRKGTLFAEFVRDSVEIWKA